MSKRNRWRLGAFGIALLVAAGVLFATSDRWMLALGRWQLHKKVGGLSYGALSFESGRFVLDGPAIADLELSAERIDIQPKWLSRRAEVKLERPHFVINEGEASEGGDFLTQLRSNRQSLVLHDGTVEVRGASQSRFFQIEGKVGPGGEGWVQLSADGQRKVHLALRGEALRGRVYEMASDDLARLLRALIPECGDLVAMGTGEVTGQLHLRLDQKRAGGELKLDGCHFALPSRGLELGCDVGRIRFERGEAQLLLERGGRLASSHWSVQDVSGLLTWGDEEVGVQLRGDVTHADVSLPLTVEGRVPLRHLEELQLQVAWPGRESSVAVLGKRLGEEEHRVALHLQRLGSRETALIGAMARDLFPTLGRTQLEAEQMEGKITGRIESGQLTELNLREFLASGVAFSCEPLGIEGKLGRARGDLALAVTSKRRLRRAMGSFEISGGELELDGTRRLSDLSAHGTLRRGKLIGGALRGRINGLLAELHLDHSSLKLTAHGPSSALLPLPSGEAMALNGEIRLLEGGFEVEGACTLGKMELPFGMRLTPVDNPSSGDLAAWTPMLLSLVDGWHGPIPSAVAVEQGWFRGRGVMLEEVVAPFAHLPCDLRGEVDLEGEFDGERMAIHYSGRDITLDSDDFHVTLPEVSQAQHQFEFLSGSQHGSVEVEGGTYLEKHLDIPFEQVSALVTLSDDGVTASNVSARWRDMQFGGSVEVEGGRIAIAAPNISGSGASTRELLRRVAPLDCWEWPIEGHAATREGGLNLLFDGDQPVSGDVALDLSSASWQLTPEARISEAAVAIDYAIETGKLTLSELHGDLELAGDTLPLEAPEVTLQDGLLTFDLRGGGDIQLKGTWGERLSLAAGSHLGGIEPCLEQFDAEVIRATPKVDLATVQRDMGWLHALEVVPFALPDLGECSGQLKGRITRNGSATHLTCEGKKITLRGRSLGRLAMRGQRLGQSWELTQGRLGDWELTGEGENLSIAHFSLTGGETFWARGKGRVVDGKWDLELERWNLALRDASMQGFLQGEGRLTGPLADPQLKGTAEGQELAWDGVRICLRQPFSLLVSKREALLDDLSGWVVDVGHPIRATADGVKIDFSGGWTLADLRFQVPVQELIPLSGRLRTLCDLPEELWEGVAALKEEGELVGRATLSPSSGTIHLQSDRYTIAGKAIDLQDPSLTYGEMGAEARGLVGKLHLLGLWKPDAPETFTLRLNTSPPDCDGEAIAAHFDLEAMKLRRLDGEIDGLKLDLKVQEREDVALHLTGRVTAGFPAINPLLPESLVSAAESAKLGEQFTLIGNFALPPDSPADVRFEGTVSADQCLVGGYRWQHLHGGLQIAPDKCELRSLSISDPAGVLRIDRVNARRQKGGQWQFTCPSVVVTDFRPTSLRRADGTLPQPRTFTITHAELTDIKGNSANPTSWSGKGYLDFSNPPKRDLSGTLFALPEDLMASLGLDLGNFVPTNGRVHYKLRGNRFVLGKLDNVYSRGQHSQFLLAKGESSIGLDGQLDLKVKVRQYNLLLKPTELFYYKIRGSFSQPKLSLEPKK